MRGVRGLPWYGIDELGRISRHSTIPLRKCGTGWDLTTICGITGNERKFTSYFPRDIVKRVLDQEMKIELENGSIWQLIGTDDFDRIMGTNPVGLVLESVGASPSNPG
jgi:hypothetical protein